MRTTDVAATRAGLGEIPSRPNDVPWPYGAALAIMVDVVVEGVKKMSSRKTCPDGRAGCGRGERGGGMTGRHYGLLPCEAKIAKIAGTIEGMGGKNTKYGTAVLEACPELKGAAFEVAVAVVKAAHLKVLAKRRQRAVNCPRPRRTFERDGRGALRSWQRGGKQQHAEARLRKAEAAGESHEKMIRRACQAELRRAGYKLEHSDGISNYYQNLDTMRTIRLSDHEVPMTDARRHAADNGQTTWAEADFIDVRKYETKPEAVAAVQSMIA